MQKKFKMLFCLIFDKSLMKHRVIFHYTLVLMLYMYQGGFCLKNILESNQTLNHWYIWTKYAPMLNLSFLDFYLLCCVMLIKKFKRCACDTRFLALESSNLAWENILSICTHGSASGLILRYF